MGSRLENFFWRIWGNQAVRDRIRGRQVAALFSNISEGGFIRTTPTQSPRNSRSIGNFRTPIPDRSPTTSPSFTLGPSSAGSSWSGEAEDHARQSTGTARGPSPTSSTLVSTSQEQKSPATLPPILKKPSAGSAIKLNKSARILSPSPTEPRRATISSGQLANTTSASSSKKGPGTIRFDSKIKSSPTEASASVAQSTEKGTKPQDQASQKSSRKKATFIVGAGSSKKRPVAVRQRSSQSSSSAASSVTSPPQSGPNAADQRSYLDTRSSSGSSHQPKRSPSTKESSPHPTKRNPIMPGDRSPKEDSSEASSDDAGAATSDSRNKEENKSPLVDPNFRSKFVDRTQPGQRSFAALSSLAPKCTAVAAAPASYQAAGMLGFGLPPQPAGRGIGRVELPEEAVSDGDQGLTRTKSQLTLLLDKDRRTGPEGSRQIEGRGERRRRLPP